MIVPGAAQRIIQRSRRNTPEWFVFEPPRFHGSSGAPRLSQETLAVLGVGIGLAALILTATTDLRGEMRVMRTELRTEMLAMRKEMRAEIQAVRTEAQADRAALRAEARADRETFERHIIRLTEQQGVLSGSIESIRNHLATTQRKARS